MEELDQRVITKLGCYRNDKRDKEEAVFYLAAEVFFCLNGGFHFLLFLSWCGLFYFFLEFFVGVCL